VSTLAEARTEVQRLESIDADTGLGEKGLVNLANAQKLRTSLEREEKRKDGEARQVLANALSHHEVILAAAYAELQSYISARQQLDDARRAAAVAEREARRRGVLDATHGDAERQFFGSNSWRTFHNVVKETLGSSIL
jgi:hypothetical protein